MKKVLLFLSSILLYTGNYAADCLDGPYGLLVNETKVEAPAFGDPDHDGRKQYKAGCVQLQAGDVVKLINLSCDATWMVDLDPYGEYKNFTGGKSTGFITCNKAGSYDFYIKLSMEKGDVLYIGPGDNCSGTPDNPDNPTQYTSSVPSQCTDVMLQAFYWDSYKDSGHGDTRWNILLAQSSEITAYFDLVWLPPSAKSSGGVGYHPTQYCNQNSAWGSRANLETLIANLHAGGAKVIADIVINHSGNKSGWCDFYEEDFGEYGSFAPDASWICKTDEVNSDKDAGSCKGAATGAADDGYGDEANYGAARDWDHNNAQVREMCRAYLQWMKAEMHYDGWRYDYCKGFHNSHINDYNKASEGYFSVMEYWDGNAATLWSRIQDAGCNPHLRLRHQVRCLQQLHGGWQLLRLPWLGTPRRRAQQVRRNLRGQPRHLPARRQRVRRQWQLHEARHESQSAASQCLYPLHAGRAVRLLPPLEGVQRCHRTYGSRA